MNKLVFQIDRPLRILAVLWLVALVCSIPVGAEPVPSAVEAKFLNDIKGASGSSELNQPAGVSLDDKGNIYVADTFNSRIVVFDPTGKVVRTFGQKGSSFERLDAPMAVDVDTEHKKVYVADSGNDRIQVYSFAGAHIIGFDLNKDIEGKEKNVRPIGIAVNSQGDFYVSDADNNLVRAYAPDGSLLFKFGGFGNGEGKFCIPVGITVDQQDHVYVVDMNNARVEVFDKEGIFLSSFGSPGDTKGSFGKPKDVAVDEHGLIFVSDAANQVVHIFDPKGVFQGLIGAEKEAELQFISPFGLAVRAGQAYIMDRGRNAVRVFQVNSKK